MAVELDWPNWPGFNGPALQRLETYDWPGNVRELRNVVERAVYRHEDPERPVEAIQFDPFRSPWGPVERRATGEEPDPIVPSAASSVVTAGTPAIDLPTSTDDIKASVNAYEKALLEEALTRHRYNQRSTAAALGLSYDQLRHAMKRHKLTENAGG
jgi:psp operon transcriptional activator